MYACRQLKIRNVEARFGGVGEVGGRARRPSVVKREDL
jgi:hypothetical protein